VGAVWLEDRKTGFARDETKKMFTQALMSVGVSAHRFAQLPDAGVVAGLLTFLQSVETFEVIRSRVNIDDAAGYFSMSSVIYWARRFAHRADTLLSQVRSGEVSPAAARSTLASSLTTLASSIGNTFSTDYWPNNCIAEYNNMLNAPVAFDPVTGFMIDG
jgi:hypothetical protein